ncbi:hypothetical protein GA0061096_1808 [Fictibacillus enclensis]|uniref:Uncharacterized protein n=1 Tax=Fictibacillus enclensis TaxID=1017270 RepID=A0A0V8JEU3_9BACL|nr:hypothetical protein [Fictibacillus enclensis]KSU85541.1 hypothetical protein AS030_08605 [Fictibacillus enclensis]SCB98529.1 hypothetical protein GA0061096_1808 [Fictibacillus enclensis]
MFDPTIYENLKVILEGMAYDLDFEGVLKVTGRKDLVDLASMSRTYSLEVLLSGKKEKDVRAKIGLKAGLEDLADEIMERETERTGCIFSVTFYTTVQDIDAECSRIGEAMRRLWKTDGEVTQTLSYIYGLPRGCYQNQIDVVIHLKLHEENSEQLEDYVNRILLAAERILNKGGR